MITLSSSTQFYLLRTNDLENHYKNRAYCPIHGSDHQRSLQITTDEQDENYGFAYCHSCHAIVVLEDLNPEAAARIREKDEQERNAGQPGRIALPPVRIRVPSAPKQQEPRPPSQDWHLLKRYREHMQHAVTYERPRAYLEQRGIPFDLAVEQGAMYLPVIPPERQTQELQRLQKWYDHLVFPLSSPESEGFIGRNLQDWTPGMDECTHRDLLKQQQIPPYQKTNPAGYFRFKEVVSTCTDIVLEEGLFDVLSTLHAGVKNVIGLVGVACQPVLFPRSVRSVKIALDADQTGQEKAQVIRKQMLAYGIKATVITCQDETLGKDWNERCRRAGTDGLADLLEVLAMDEQGFCCQCGAIVEHYDNEGRPYCAEHYPVLARK